MGFIVSQVSKSRPGPPADKDRFALILSQISGKRLTYAELTGKMGETAL